MKLREFTLTLFYQKLRESNVFLKKWLKSWFDEIFSVRLNFYFSILCCPHRDRVEIKEILLHVFCQKFRENNGLPKKLLKSWFNEIFFQLEKIYDFSTVCLVKSTLTLWHLWNCVLKHSVEFWKISNCTDFSWN